MNCHVVYTSGQREFLDRYFMPSLKDGWNIVAYDFGDQAAFAPGTKEWQELLLRKMDLLVDKIIPDECASRFFVLSDIDLQFFRPVTPLMMRAIESRDIVFQNEWGGNGQHWTLVNTGFMMMRPSYKILEFWTEVREIHRRNLEAGKYSNEQAVANSILLHRRISWGFLPDEIWAWTNANIRHDSPRIRDLHMHHANGTFGDPTKPNEGKDSQLLKLEQLEYVRERWESLQVP